MPPATGCPTVPVRLVDVTGRMALGGVGAGGGSEQAKRVASRNAAAESFENSVIQDGLCHPERREGSASESRPLATLGMTGCRILLSVPDSGARDPGPARRRLEELRRGRGARRIDRDRADVSGIQHVIDT